MPHARIPLAHGKTTSLVHGMPNDLHEVLTVQVLRTGCSGSDARVARTSGAIAPPLPWPESGWLLRNRVLTGRRQIAA